MRPCGWLLHCHNRRDINPQHDAAEILVAAGFEACYGLPQVFVHLFFYEEDAMQVVRHHLHGKDLDFGLSVRYCIEVALYCCPQFVQYHAGLVVAAFWGIASPRQRPE